jgi:hypothetical protein
VHEIKHDGYRLIVRRDGKAVRLFTRRGHDWTDRYPAIAAVAANVATDGPLPLQRYQPAGTPRMIAASRPTVLRELLPKAGRPAWQAVTGGASPARQAGRHRAMGQSEVTEGSMTHSATSADNYGPWFPECRISCIQYPPALSVTSPTATPKNWCVIRPANRKAPPTQSRMVVHRLAFLKSRTSFCQVLFIARSWQAFPVGSLRKKAPLSQGPESGILS